MLGTLVVVKENMKKTSDWKVCVGAALTLLWEYLRGAIAAICGVVPFLGRSSAVSRIGVFGGYLSCHIVAGSFRRPLEVSYGHWLAE